MDYKSSLMKITEDYITSKGWSSAINDADQFIVSELELDNEMGSVPFILVPTDDGIVSYATLRDEILPEMYPTVAEYLHRANYGLLNGCFELDYANGSVQYRTFCCCLNGREPSDADLDMLFAVPLAVLNRYIDGLRQILNGTAKDAYELIAQSEAEQ